MSGKLEVIECECAANFNGGYNCVFNIFCAIKVVSSGVVRGDKKECIDLQEDIWLICVSLR